MSQPKICNRFGNMFHSLKEYTCKSSVWHAGNLFGILPCNVISLRNMLENVLHKRQGFPLGMIPCAEHGWSKASVIWLKSKGPNPSLQHLHNAQLIEILKIDNSRHSVLVMFTNTILIICCQREIHALSIGQYGSHFEGIYRWNQSVDPC